jgi:hypothetical protein
MAGRRSGTCDPVLRRAKAIDQRGKSIAAKSRTAWLLFPDQSERLPSMIILIMYVQSIQSTVLVYTLVHPFYSDQDSGLGRFSRMRSATGFLLLLDMAKRRLASQLLPLNAWYRFDAVFVRAPYERNFYFLLRTLLSYKCSFVPLFGKDRAVGRDAT